MAGDIADYLSIGTADYTATQLELDPDDVFVENVSFKQDVIEYDDDSVQVLTHSVTPKFRIRLKWDVLTEEDAQTIFDFYCDVAKGKGMARTFEFPHPTDGMTYIVRFFSDMSKTIQHLNLYGIQEIVLKPEGVKTS